ncbi:MAG: FMN-binding protein [Deltaproteobacteria bacterium]|nr:FMN-binding protein [Deltaproteobacteria bacterium]NND28161.1 FMN-binding protein [Myxococcales bacterium]MBT8464413.1 FMN-binding protein [Deltaproteobacteria bacterium]MBT8480336.1 FMN-binding protein [Deltaproteobacteria bacterium]NNK06681.1 FMN-binding protein [Myxococcales bacterium]
MSQSELATAPAPAAPSIWHMYRAMVGVGVFCGLLIVSVFQVTLPIIERNKAEALQEAIFEVLPNATKSTTYRLTEAGGFELVEGEDDAGRLVYAGYDDAEQLVGLAVEAEGMGYQDVIALIYGYSFTEQAIVGIQVLESKETPGLGDKIETDADFLENFKSLDVSVGEDGSALANSVVPVKHGEKTQPWEVDGITGATISSVAIANLLDRSAQYWVPRIRNNLADFQGQE